MDMKIKFFVYLLLLNGFIQADFSGDKDIVIPTLNPGHFYVTNECYRQLSPSAKNFRERLYWLDKYNPRYYLLEDFQKDLDYSIAILADHIQVLEDKIIQQKSKLKSMTMVRAAIFSVLSIFSAQISFLAYKFRKDKELCLSSNEAIAGSVFYGALTALFTTAAVIQFKRIFYYAERLRERLERDKRILNILKKEKAAKSFKGGGN